MSHIYHYLHYFSFYFSNIQFETNSVYCHCNRRYSRLKWVQVIIVCVVCCITTVIWLRSYIFLINLFYIINRLIKQNLYRFFHYSNKEGKFIFCYGAKLDPKIRLILFLDYLKLLYEYYLSLSTLFIIFLFIRLIQNQLSAATVTIVTPVLGKRGQLKNSYYDLTILSFFYFHKVIVWVLLIIVYIIFHSVFQASDAKSTLHWLCYSPR